MLVCAVGRSSAFLSEHPASAAFPTVTSYHPRPLTKPIPLSCSEAASRQMKTMMLDPSQANIDTTLFLSETQPWVQPTAVALDLFTNFFSLAMLIRVVLSWYPQTNVKELPWSLVVFPTEPLLKVVRGSIPPAFGVDITPIVWLGFFTFVHEILLGQQGLLTMKMKYGI